MSEAHENSFQHPNEGAVKRSLSCTPEGPAKKKLHVEGTEQFSVKILIPSLAVGAIIGRGGDVMKALKADHNCIVHMSKNGDTFPGTSERVCLVRGRFPDVTNAIGEMTERIHEKCGDVMGTDIFDLKETFRGLEIKLVVPNSSAGMVIGKGGSTIKYIKDSTGCQLQVMPKSGTHEASQTKERVVVVASSSLPGVIGAVERVLERIAADPHHASELNREEAKVPKFSPFASASSVPKASPVSHTNAPSSNMNTPMHPALSMGNHELMLFLDSLQYVLSNSGFNEPSISEVMGAMQVLAKYNLMSVGLGFGAQAMVQMRTQSVQQPQVQQPQMQQHPMQSPQMQQLQMQLPPPAMAYQAYHAHAGYAAAHPQQQPQPQQQQQYTTHEYWKAPS